MTGNGLLRLSDVIKVLSQSMPGAEWFMDELGPQTWRSSTVSIGDVARAGGPVLAVHTISLLDWSARQVQHRVTSALLRIVRRAVGSACSPDIAQCIDDVARWTNYAPICLAATIADARREERRLWIEGRAHSDRSISQAALAQSAACGGLVALINATSVTDAQAAAAEAELVLEASSEAARIRALAAGSPETSDLSVRFADLAERQLQQADIEHVFPRVAGSIAQLLWTLCIARPDARARKSHVASAGDQSE